MSGNFLSPPIIQASSNIDQTRPVDIYANQIRIGTTLADFTLVFGSTEDAGLGQVINRDRAIVRLAPGTAKSLLLHLTMILQSYEEAIGPLPMPAQMVAELADIKQKITAGYAEQMQQGGRAQRTSADA